jgi:UDP-glucose 4-epimerase
MKVLAAGSEGLLMQTVIRHLIRDGHAVRGVDNFGRHGRVDRKRDYEFLEGDLTKAEFVNEVMRGIEVVIQGAGAAYGVIALNQRPADHLFNDVVLHANVLQAATRNKVQKLAYVSSSMVYEGCLKNPIAEDDLTEMIPVPRTALGLSKLVGERLCQAYAAQYGLKYTIWRPFNIIAAGEKAGAETGVAHVYADFIRKIVHLKQNPLEILGDGKQIRCFVWVEDIASAIAKFSFEEATDGRAYNLGNPEPVTMLELAKKVHQRAQLMGFLDGSYTLRFSHRPAPAEDVRALIPSIDRARRELGWQPVVSLDGALELCIKEALGSRPPEMPRKKQGKRTETC